MKYEQVEKIAKKYNEIQRNQNRLEELKDITDLFTLRSSRIKSFEEVEILTKFHAAKIQQLKEELTNATIGKC